MAAPNTYNDQQREAMIELAGRQGLTLRRTQAILEGGYENLEPFKPSTATIAAARDQAKPQIADQEPAAAIDQLARRTFGTIDKYVAAIEKNPENFDADDALKVIRTLVEAKALIQPKRNNTEDKGNGTLGHLSSVPTPGATSKRTEPVPARSLGT